MIAYIVLFFKNNGVNLIQMLCYNHTVIIYFLFLILVLVLKIVVNLFHLLTVEINSKWHICMNDLLLIPVIFLAIGRIVIFLWRLFLIASGHFFIGFDSILIFVEGCGIYLFFTEPTLYMEDLSQNGLISFTGFYAVFNLSLLLCGVLKIISWTRRLKSS